MLDTLLYALLIVVPLLIYASHLLQKIKLEKARRVAEITYRYKVSHAIASGIPPQYLSQELTLFILGESISLLEQLRRETPRDRKVLVALEGKKQQWGAVQTDYVKPQPMVMSSVKEARAVQGRLDALRNIVTAKLNTRKLEPAQAKVFVRHLNWQIIRCMTDVLMDRAQKLAETKSFRISIHTYNNALGLFERLPGHRKANLSAEKCRQKIDAVEVAFQSYLAQVELEAKAAREAKKSLGSPTLDEAWEKKYGGTLSTT